MSSTNQVNVLVVDDKEANLLALEHVLEGTGLNIVKASSGNEALSRLLDMEFACVLLDVKIPDINGFELATIIRGDVRTKYLPVIFVSGHRKGEEDVFRGYELGAVDYLMKPLDPTVVKGKVNVFAELFRKEVALRSAEAELRKNRDELEKRVEERTHELMEQASKLARSNEELAKFAYVSSHDLKEPIRMVLMYVQLLKQGHSQYFDEEGQTCLRYIIEGASRMQRLVDDLLTYSHINNEAGPPPLIDSEEVVREVESNLKGAISESGAVLTIDKNLPKVSMRADQLTRVFQNLIENAIKFRTEFPPKIHVGIEEEAEAFRFFISDTGVGIDPAYHGKIFELFQRLQSRERYPGTGIGLAVCKKIVELNKGRIWVESREGKGAIFNFTLPKPVLEEIKQ
jgi:signal transduction histidine kinase